VVGKKSLRPSIFVQRQKRYTVNWTLSFHNQPDHMIAQAVQYNNVCGQKEEMPPYNYRTIWVDLGARSWHAL